MWGGEGVATAIRCAEDGRAVGGVPLREDRAVIGSLRSKVVL